MIFEIDSLKTVRYRWILFIIIRQYFWNGTRLIVHQVTLVLINSLLNYLHPSKTFTETAAIILNGSLLYVQYRLHLYSNVSHNHILLAQLQHSTRPLNKAHVFHIRSNFSICFSFLCAFRWFEFFSVQQKAVLLLCCYLCTAWVHTYHF